MAPQLPTLNKPIEVDSVRGLGAPLNQNTNFKLAILDTAGNLEIFIRETLSIDINTRPRVSTARAIAFDRITNTFWNYGDSGLRRRPWNEVNQFEAQLPAADIVTTPPNFPTPASVRDMAVHFNYIVLAVRNQDAMPIWEYDPNFNTVTLVGELRDDSFNQPGVVDIGNSYVVVDGAIYDLVYDAVGRPGVTNRRFIRIELFNEQQSTVAIGSLGNRTDLIIATGVNNNNELYIEASPISFGVVNSGEILGLARSPSDIVILSYQAPIINPTQVQDDEESLGKVILTPLEFSLVTESVGQESAVSGITTFTQVPVYDTPGAARVTFQLNQYQSHHLLISGWTFTYQQVRYRLEAIDSDSDNVFGIFTATVV